MNRIACANENPSTAPTNFDSHVCRWQTLFEGEFTPQLCAQIVPTPYVSARSGLTIRSYFQ
jgi:hypothetical protein